MPEPTPHKVRLPPRWLIRVFWVAHRRLYRWTGGRLGLWRPKPGRWGAMRLTTRGRRTGRDHAVIVGYFEDGPNVVTMAMNGWGGADPAWWLNLQAHPDVTVDLPDGPRQVMGRAAQGDERERLWARWQQIDKHLDAYAARRSISPNRCGSDDSFGASSRGASGPHTPRPAARARDRTRRWQRSSAPAA